MMIFESEMAMEDALFEVIERTKVVPWDGRPVMKVVRQARLGSFGVSDIIIVVQDGPHDDDITLVLVELKNTKVKAEHLSQVARYKTFLDKTLANVECVLMVTPGMPDETDVCYLIQHSDWLTTYEISVSLDSGASYRCLSACNWSPTSAGQSPESFYDELTSGIEAASETNCDIGF